MKKFFTELYFYKDDHDKTGYTKIPNIHKYKTSPLSVDITATDWKDAEKQIVDKYSTVAYIHVIESRDLGI